jgi:hypothetical protein
MQSIGGNSGHQSGRRSRVKRLAESPVASGLVVACCYFVPLLLLGLFYLPVNAGVYVYFRNWLRAGCGPAVAAMRSAGFDPNDLATYAAAFVILWSAWAGMLICLGLWRRLPVAVHAVLGFLWCFGGCGLTLSI